MKALEGWTPAHLDLMNAWLADIERLAESPIERQFGIAAAAVFCRTEFVLLSQYQLTLFRYDFAVKGPLHEWIVALIECDGKEFHSTKKQRNNDASKDEAARVFGAIILRYPGREIFRDPKRCAEDAHERVARRWRYLTTGR